MKTLAGMGVMLSRWTVVRGPAVRTYSSTRGDLERRIGTAGDGRTTILLEVEKCELGWSALVDVRQHREDGCQTGGRGSVMTVRTKRGAKKVAADQLRSFMEKLNQEESAA